MTSMEGNGTGKQPQWKMTLVAKNLNRKLPRWNMTLLRYIQQNLLCNICFVFASQLKPEFGTAQPQLVFLLFCIDIENF